MKLLQWQDILSPYGFNTCLPHYYIHCHLNKTTIALHTLLHKHNVHIVQRWYGACIRRRRNQSCSNCRLSGPQNDSGGACMNENLGGGSALSGIQWDPICTTSFEQKTLWYLLQWIGDMVCLSTTTTQTSTNRTTIFGKFCVGSCLRGNLWLWGKFIYGLEQINPHRVGVLEMREDCSNWVTFPLLFLGQTLQSTMNRYEFILDGRCITC